MPRKHKGEDNITPFRTTRTGTTQSPGVEQQVEDGTPVVIQKIDENRVAGMKNLETKCNSFESRELITKNCPIGENTVRELESAIKSTLLTLEAMNSLLDMMRHDLVGCIQNTEAQSVSGWQMSAHLQTLLELMKRKNIVTEEELKSVWDEIIPEQVRKLREAKKEFKEPE